MCVKGSQISIIRKETFHFLFNLMSLKFLKKYALVSGTTPSLPLGG
jgi:hypothetical protein